MNKYKHAGARLFIREHNTLPEQAKQVYIPVRGIRISEKNLKRRLGEAYNNGILDMDKTTRLAENVDLWNALSRRNISFDVINHEYEYHLTPEQAVKFRRLIDAYEK